MARQRKKFFHVWFEFFPIYLGRKKGTSKTFLSLGLRPRLQKTFSRFPFFYLGILEKTQIRREKIFPLTCQEQLSKQNTISLDLLALTIFYCIKKVQVRLMEKFPQNLLAVAIFFSFLQNHIQNTNLNQLHPSHRRDACNKHPHWTAAFVNKIWHIWLWICLMKATKKPEKWKKHSVSIIVLAIVFEKISPRMIWIS